MIQVWVLVWGLSGAQLAEYPTEKQCVAEARSMLSEIVVVEKRGWAIRVGNFKPDRNQAFCLRLRRR